MGSTNPRSVRRWTALLVGAALLGCATYNLLTPEDRQVLERTLIAEGRGDRYLRLSFYITPFFGDASKKLLTPYPPDQVRLLEQPDGTPISPGPAEKIVPAGTKARIVRIEFPTPWAVAERITFTPRTQPWVFLELEGEPSSPPLVLVLRPKIESQADFLAELDRYLTDRDPSQILKTFTEPIRAAVKIKKAVVDMPAEALEMAWGYPERKRIFYEGQVKKEDWTYPGNLRVAHLADGRLLSFEPP